MAPILKDVAEEPDASLGMVVQRLIGSRNNNARNLGTVLSLLKELPLAGLCFGRPGAHLSKISLNEGLTVITFAGMEMPKPDGNDNKTRLATGILYLVTDFVRRLMESQGGNNPKTVVIDEAWSIIQTKAGAAVIKELALLGRSKNLALLLVTQNNSHLSQLDIDNTIMTRFAFKSSTKEAESIIGDMRLPEDEGFESVVTGLDRGEALMQDFKGRFSTVMISDWNKRWKEAFRTNPLEKQQQREAAEEKKRAAQASRP